MWGGVVWWVDGGVNTQTNRTQKTKRTWWGVDMLISNVCMLSMHAGFWGGGGRTDVVGELAEEGHRRQRHALRLFVRVD